MKKRIFIGALSCALLLAGCGSGANYAERKTLDPNVISKNAVDLAKQEATKNYDVVKSHNSMDFDNLKVANSSYANKGVIVTKNEQGYIGFYNLLTDKKITNNCFEEGFTSYTITSNSNVGFILNIQYLNTTIVFDGLGNKLYEGESFIETVFKNVDADLYVTVYGESYTKIYKYDETSLTTVDKIPTPQAEPDADDEKEYYNFTHGSAYTDIQRISLKNFGHDGYHASIYGSLISVFDKQDKVISTFNIPTSGSFGIIGDNFLCQEIFTTSDMAEEYDFIDEAHKYTAHTYSINYMNGKRKEIETKYKLGSLTPFKDKDGNYKYGLADIQLIESGKMLGNRFTYLMDSKLNFVQDVTGEDLKSFSKLPNGYFYNTSTKILYDDKMKIVSYLNGINPSLDIVNGLFWGSMEQKIGALDLTGKVVIPFEYTEKVSNIENNFIYLRKQDNSIEKYDVSTGDKYSITDNVVALTKNLLLLKNENSDTLKYVKPSGNIISYTPVSGSTRSGGYISMNLDNVRFYIEKISEPFTAISGAKLHIINFMGEPLRTYRTTVYGTEKTAKIYYGDTVDNAIEIGLGTTTVTQNIILGRYAAYYAHKNTTTEIKRVTLEFNVNYQSVSSMKFRSETGTLTTANYDTDYSSSNYKYSFNIPAKSDLVFYIEASYSSYRTFTLTEVEKGSSINYPLEIVAGNKKSISLKAYTNFYVKVTNLNTYSLYSVNPTDADGVQMAECAQVGFNVYGAFVASSSSMTFELISATAKTVSFIATEKVPGLGDWAEDLHQNEELKNAYLGLYIYRNTSSSTKTMYLNCIFSGTHTITSFFANNSGSQTTYTESVFNAPIRVPANDIFVIYCPDYINASISFSKNEIDIKYLTTPYGFSVVAENESYSSNSTTGTNSLTFNIVENITEFGFNYDFKRYSSSEQVYIYVNGVIKQSITANETGGSFQCYDLVAGDVVSVNYNKTYSSKNYYFNVYNIYAE